MAENKLNGIFVTDTSGSMSSNPVLSGKLFAAAKSKAPNTNAAIPTPGGKGKTAEQLKDEKAKKYMRDFMALVRAENLVSVGSKNLGYLIDTVARQITYTINDGGECYTDGKSIVVSMLSYFLNEDWKEFWPVILKGLAAHESQHVNSSSFTLFKSIQQWSGKYFKDNFQISEQTGASIGQWFMNVFEDGRIEAIVCRKMAVYVTIFRIINGGIRKLNTIVKPEKGQQKDEMEEYGDFSAQILSYAKTGRNAIGISYYKGKRLEKEFVGIRQYIDEAVASPDCQGCYDAVKKAIEKCAPYIADLIRKQDQLNQMIQQMLSQMEWTSNPSDGEEKNDDSTGSGSCLKKLRKQPKGGKGGKGSKAQEESDDGDEEDGEGSGKGKKGQKSGKKDGKDKGAGGDDGEDEADGDDDQDGDGQDGKDGKDKGKSKGQDGDDSDDGDGDGSGKDSDGKGSDQSDSGDEEGSPAGGDSDGEAGEGSDQENNERSTGNSSGGKAKPVDHGSNSSVGGDGLTEDGDDPGYTEEEARALLDQVNQEAEWSAAQDQHNDLNANASKLESTDLSKVNAHYKNGAPRFIEDRILMTASPTPENIKQRGKKFGKVIATILQIRRQDVRGVRHGALDLPNVWQSRTGNNNVFVRRGDPRKPECAIFGLMDNSGSMGGRKEMAARQAMAIIEEGLPEGIALKLALFDADYSAVRHRVIKDWTDRGRVRNYCVNSMTHCRPGGCNMDGYSIRVAVTQLLSRREKKKVLILLSDGLPSAYNSEAAGIEDVRDAVRDAKSKGVIVIPIMFGDQSFVSSEINKYRKMYGGEVIACSPNRIEDEFCKLFKKLITQR